MEMQDHKIMEMQDHDPREDDFDDSIVDDVIDSDAMEVPAEFRLGFWESMDKRFISVLIGSIVFHITFVTYFLLNPLPEEQAMMRVAKIQAQLAKRIYERELELEATRAKLAMNQPQGDKPKPEAKKPKTDKPKTDKPKSDKTAVKKGTKTKKAKSPPRKSRQQRRGSRGKSRQQIANAVSSKGVLALLTSSSTVASGSEVADILTGKNHLQKDLDKAISGLSGLRTGTSGTTKATNVKGGRSQGGGGIDDLVADLSDTEGGSFERSGDLVSVGESTLVGGGDGNGIVGRNQDDVQGMILKHNNSVQYCYQRELKRNPNIKGKLVVRFSITPQGTVKDVEVISSTLNNRKVERCVSNRIRRWSDFGAIDASYGDTTVRQAYAFGY